MATEDILIRYRADVSQLESDLNKLIDSQEELTQATKQQTTEVTKAANAAEFAAKKRAQLLELERQKLEKLKEAQKLAFDPTQIEKYNNQIAQSQKRIETLGGSYQKATEQVKTANQDIVGGLNKIAGLFGLAFSAEALVGFAQKAVTAFLAAEEQANKLRFAIVNIGGEGEDALGRLNAQAEQLAAVTFFGDDDIKAAQAALSAFGLTAKQIEDSIPALLDYAAVTGEDLTSAVNAVGGALEGRAGQFKKFGVEVDANSTKAENLNKVLKGLSSQAGAAGDALQTASGQAKDFQDQLGEVTETIGQGIVEFFTEQLRQLKDLFQPLIDNIKEIGNAIKNLIPDGVADKLGQFIDKGTALKTVFYLLNAPLVILVKSLQFFTSIITTAVPYVAGFIEVVKSGFTEIKDLASNLGAGLSDLFSGIFDLDPGKLKSGLNKLKGGFQNLGFDVAKSFNAGYEKGQSLFKDAAKTVGDAQNKLSDNLLKSDELRKKSLTELNKLQQKYANDQSNAGRQNLESVQKEIEARKKAGEASKKAGDEAAKQAEEVKKLIQSIDQEIAKLQADLAKRKIEVIPAKTFEEQAKRIQDLADLNEQAITDEIAGKIKSVQEDAKLSAKQKADVIAKYNELKQARLNLAQFNEQNELNILSKKQADAITKAFADIEKLDFEKALSINANDIEMANEKVAKSFEDLGKAVGKNEFEAAKTAAENATKELQKQIQTRFFLRETEIENARDAEKQKAIDAGATTEELLAIDTKYNNQLEDNASETSKKLKKANKDYTDFVAQQNESAAARWINANQEVLQQTQAILTELNGIFKAASDERIANIEKERNAQLESIQMQLDQNKQYLDERKISEEEAAANEKALTEERAKIERETQKKINDEKRKQAILDKAAALFDIALNTSVAVAKVMAQTGIVSPALIPLIIAQGAIQAAAVAAKPIPYRKGSKNTGNKEHMARVGEEGEEFVWMPANSKVLPTRQTRKYSDVIDAMYDNKLDDYIYKNYITPALMAQREAKESQRAKSFAQNMADSIYYNQSGLTASDLEAQRKRGQYIRNVDELADAIAKRIPTRDIYRA